LVHLLLTYLSSEPAAAHTQACVCANKLIGTSATANREANRAIGRDVSPAPPAWFRLLYRRPIGSSIACPKVKPAALIGSSKWRKFFRHFLKPFARQSVEERYSFGFGQSVCWCRRIEARRIL